MKLIQFKAFIHLHWFRHPKKKKNPLKLDVSPRYWPHMKEFQFNT